MLNPKYKDYYYGLWIVTLNKTSEPMIIEGSYGMVVKEAKSMNGFSDETTIEKIQYKKVGRRNLEIDQIWIAKHDICPNGVIGIEWSGSDGFGRYELILGDDGKLHANTEHMDSELQKLFSQEVLTAVINNIVIDE